MVNMGYPTHRKRHSSLYESNHRNEDLPFFPMCHHLIWSIIPQGNSLQNVILSPKALHTGGSVYKMLKSTHLVALRNVILSPKALHTGGSVYKMLKSTHLGRLKGKERSL